LRLDFFEVFYEAEKKWNVFFKNILL